MWEWGGPAELAWIAWGVWALWRAWPRARDPAVPVGLPPVCRSAMLLNAEGRLDSVRTLTGPPPVQMTTRGTTYVLDRAASQTHWVYRVSHV